ncbi:hypothetical protein J2853_002272 [Streptosporangium lutulentum]|uniref:Uncharacterized protein n=1 Tax=Streptosporangium lutulentum TaxID=1461250 RepID=A0ABT9Q8K9_9ACTN|nr:hypothetical protein [Streptosporangium lutulentum]
MVQTLQRVIPESPGKPVPEGAAALQELVACL